MPFAFLTACSLNTAKHNKTIVTFWHGMESGVNNQVLQAKLDLFNAQHPGIFIDAQVYGAADQLGPKLDAAVAGKTPPDLLWWSPAFFPKYAAAGALRNLDELIAQDAAFDRADVYDYLWELGSFDNKLYVTPFSANNLGIYYNKQMLSEAGIAQPPQTWDEFKTTARKLTRNGVYGFQIPIGTSEWTVWTWQCYLWQAGGELLTPDKKQAAFNSAAGVAALDFWKSLYDEKLANFSETDAGYKTDNILAGRIAMTINGPWNYADLKTQPHIGVFALPRQQRAATNIGGESLFLFKTNAQRERAAWEFMKFVMSADFQVDWAMATGYLPVSKSAANSAPYQAFLQANPFIKAYNDQMPVGRTRPSIPQYPALSLTLGKYLEAALYGKLSAQEALDKAATEVNAILQKAGN
ncbi:MAG: ABC transporter substrate-binding protein [Acidobacteria bacterium]|nr:ABC transporter substrate-binding protein [Acidobacteriota bacterium]MBI3424053.1 ABC transporter substrate-binding protein [Acidobacteriota bacterium]